MNGRQNESLLATVAAYAARGMSISHEEALHAQGMYKTTLRGFKPEHEDVYLRMHAHRARMILEANEMQGADWVIPTKLADGIALFDRELALMEFEKHDVAPNIVTTPGGNYLLDNGLAGSAFTAALYLGLMSLVGYGAGAVLADTQASHAGWTEAGLANVPTYSGARKAAAWAAAAAKSKSFSAGVVFTFNGGAGGTVKGCFLTTSSAIDATTGVLYSAGLFAGGDQPVVPTNTLTVTYTATV